jgi:CHASE3 domain sensor protein
VAAYVRGRVMDRRRRLGKGTPYERVGELRNLSEQELIAKHDSWIDHANNLLASDKTAITNRAQTYMNELHRRESIRQGERMEALTRSLNHLTKWIVALTVLIAIATLIGVFLAALTLTLGG